MPKVSSVFTVTAINDGQTVTATITTSASLAQKWANGVAIPDWSSQTGSRPTLTVKAYRNGTQCSIEKTASGDSTHGWFWNGTPISMSNPEHASRFQIGWNNDASGAREAKLTLIGNLASGSNVTDDVIEFRGQVMLSTSSQDFSVGQTVRISEAGQSAYEGVLEFVDSGGDPEDAPTVISDPTDVLYVRASLFSGSGSADFTPRWYKHGEVWTEKGSDKTISVSANEVDDRAVVRCDFLDTNDSSTVLASAHIVVDDTQDRFELFMASLSGSTAGTPAPEGLVQLRPGDTAKMVVWMGENNNPLSQLNEDWSYGVMVFNAGGSVLTSFAGKNASQNNIININAKSTVAGLAFIKDSYNHGELTISYDHVNATNVGGQAELRVIAEKS